MKKIIPILILLISIFGCDNKKSKLEFEKKVMLEIYPSLIDSLWIHDNSSHALPFVKLDKKGNVIGHESKKEINNNYKKELARIKKTNSKIFAVIYDTINRIQQSDRNELTEYFKGTVISKNRKNDTLEYPLDRKKFKKLNHATIKFISKYNLEERPWETNSNFYFFGFISFSRIQFDINRKYGILTSEIHCGAMCGHGYRVFIKKVKDKWIIDKVEKAWIS